MAEGARLESVYTRKCIEGSNPSLTAIFEQKALTKVRAFFFCVFFCINKGFLALRLAAALFFIYVVSQWGKWH